jgi:hypothetical protein
VLSAGNGSETRLFFQLGGLAALGMAGLKIENCLREQAKFSPALDGEVWPSARREARSTQELLGALWSSKGCCVGKAAG